ncbi:hypothetical protein RhiirA5_445634 [Rhizophagus irregularis]|uniref:Uncharacterized protein n=1 Tax=Rhizophagus irregularis TaxID=588596 RepID=A0A2N0NC96_9GLOM|nr:hypothetical protein RhiirA5_445634 [Rhizophagus irregularis]GET52443.1 hypothetical protein RIR_e56331_A0A2N0NC96_9GLOM [Rhizophagus irregularis DAOM 181602=DAOM 197198]
MQDDEEIKNGELIFAELETYLDNAKKIVIEQHQLMTLNHIQEELLFHALERIIMRIQCS